MIRFSVFVLALWTALAVAAGAQSQTDQPQIPQSSSSSSKSAKKSKPAQSSTPEDPDDILNAPMTPPRSDSNDDTREPAPGSYSTSNDRRDISPPAGDAKDHPGSGEIEIVPAVPDDVLEAKPWNPHEADKDVEVGMFYFKRGNLRAAEARFRDALKWQDNHAEATYRLAVVFEKEGQKALATQKYEQYLKILPQGEFAADSKKALERINNDGEKKTAKK